MTFHPLKNTQDRFFNTAWELYEEAFPPQEKRFLAEQIQLLDNHCYTFQAIHENHTFIGIIGFWAIDEFIFIEHFAISSSLRGKNYGTLILNEFLKEKKYVILEIEPPLNQQNLKRLHFYKNLGFVQNTIEHFQVPFRTGDTPIALELLSYKIPLEQDKYQFLYSSMQKLLPI